MSFVEGFYSFNLDITNSDQGRYAQLRIKTARHPYESDEYFTARVVAFVHAYEQGLAFSQGLYETSEPTLWRKDELNATTAWIEVGHVEEKKLKNALRLSQREGWKTSFSCYFFDQSQIDEFAHVLRGSKTNWIESVRFSILDINSLQQLAPELRSNSRWSITIVDDQMYFFSGNIELQLNVRELDMWAEHQRLIETSLSE